MDKKMMFLAPGMILGAVMLAAEPQTAETPAAGTPDNLTRRVDVGRQQLYFESGVKMKEANRKAFAREFDAAIQEYREVIKLLEPVQSGERFKDRIEMCRKRIKECYLQKADEAMKKADDQATSNDFEAAVNTCREAQKYCPEKRDELAKKIAFYERRRNAALNRENSSMGKLAPNNSVQEYNIQRLLEQGRALAERDELTQAKRKFEEVLLLDPFNAEGIKNLEGVYNRIRKDAKIRASATARRMISKVEWDATIPIVPDAPVGEPENQLDQPVAKVAESPLEKKLKAIIIPRLTIEDNDITFSQLMQDISRDCRRYDPERRGVNFVVRPVPVTPGQEEPTLKGLSIERRSVYDLLEDLQKGGILSFKIGGNAVLVAPSGVPLEEMEVRHFSYALKTQDKPESLKNLFVSQGIPFGEGTSVEIIRARNHVVVCNTPENLKKVGYVLESMRDSEPMVQVMFKFIEVNQNDLDELGFNWAYSRFNSKGYTGVMNTNELLRHYSPDSADRFDGNAASGQKYDLTSPVKSAITAPQEDSDATYQFMWYDRKNFLSMSVYALDWADSTDVLYSPRVTTLSGTTAKIDMSETHYYPKDWENIDSESNENFRIEVPTPQPSLEDEQKLGVWFEITPKAKGDLIEVPINIPIIQFAGWMVVDTRSGGDDDDGEYIKKPIFTDRTIKTIVTVKDGETVLIGGVTQDLSKSIDDKVPILGDIPFIGRFFQSKYMNSQKNHLLVFMTCRLIKPDGSAINPKTENNGAPEFSRNM